MDCPESHAEIEKVKSRLDEAMQEIDTATNDPKTRDNIQKTWRLQDLLVFPNAVCVTRLLRQRLFRSTDGSMFEGFTPFRTSNARPSELVWRPACFLPN